MIACLGWGFLIWDPRDLLVGESPADGPFVKVEFARQSAGDRLTLVLDDDAEQVQSLWARVTRDGLQTAVTSLARREGTSRENIHRWSRGQADPTRIPGLVDWAASRDIEYVIWTALGPKFGELPTRPTEPQALAYLKRLSNEGKAARVEEYVRRAPQQVRTIYRRRIERCLGWTPLA